MDDRPLYYIGDGPREDVLFYLGRTLPRIDSIDQLPPQFNGFAIVTSTNGIRFHNFRSPSARRIASEPSESRQALSLPFRFCPRAR